MQDHGRDLVTVPQGAGASKTQPVGQRPRPAPAPRIDGSHMLRAEELAIDKADQHRKMLVLTDDLREVGQLWRIGQVDLARLPATADPPQIVTQRADAFPGDVAIIEQLSRLGEFAVGDKDGDAVRHQAGVGGVGAASPIGALPAIKIVFSHNKTPYKTGKIIELDSFFCKSPPANVFDAPSAVDLGEADLFFFFFPLPDPEPTQRFRNAVVVARAVMPDVSIATLTTFLDVALHSADEPPAKALAERAGIPYDRLMRHISVLAEGTRRVPGHELLVKAYDKKLRRHRIKVTPKGMEFLAQINVEIDNSAGQVPAHAASEKNA